jgi:hypothetical protein
MWKKEAGIFKEGAFPYFHFVTTCSCKDLKNIKNRAGFLKKSGIDPGALVTAEQVHGSSVKVVGRRDRGKTIPGVDGLITAEKQLPLAIFTADCMPIFLCDKENKVTGVVHAGWRGLVKGIIKQAVNIFKQEFKCNPENISAAAGPHIQKCCFEVGDELKGVFGLKGSENKADMSRLARKSLEEEGIKNISISDRCTFHDDLFFSYRRNKTAERMMSLVMVKRKRCE